MKFERTTHWRTEIESWVATITKYSDDDGVKKQRRNKSF